MSERFRSALTGAWQRIEERQWLFGWLGKTNNDESVTYLVPGRKNFLYVTLRNSSGAQTVVPARNDAAVPLEARLPVKLRLEKGVYVIQGRTARSDLGTVVIPPGVNHHALGFHSDVGLTSPILHDALTFDGTDWINTPYDYAWLTNTPTSFAPVAHADSHKHLGTDEIATATPAANAIPKADGSGKLDGWVTLITDHGGLSGLTDDDHTQYLLASGARPLSANWDAGDYEIRARTFQSDVAYGTPAMVITSTTKINNLNSDMMDSHHGTWYQDSANFTGTNWVDLTDAGATILHKHDHGGQDGLTDDDHTQYLLLAGRAGGQAVLGGTGSGDDLSLESTANATKGDVVLQPNGGNVGIGGAPSYSLHLQAGEQSSGVMAHFAGSRAGSNINTQFEHTGAVDAANKVQFNWILQTSSQARTAASMVAGFTTTTDASRTALFELRVANAGASAARMAIAGDLMGIGTTAPQGLLHAYKSPGSVMHWSKAGVDNTPSIIIADGTGDVAYGLIYWFLIESTTVAGDMGILYPGDTYDVAVGSGTYRFAVSAGGAFTVVRQAGTGTARVAVWALWM